MECLLENYLESVDSISKKIELIRLDIEGSINVLEIQLDALRNRILKIDLIVSVVTLAAGIGALVYISNVYLIYI